MRKIALFTLVFCISISSSCIGQDKADSLAISEIDTQVWDTFKAAYATSDGKLYNSIHTDDILRVTESGIRIGDEYKSSILKWFGNDDRSKRTIDFSFDQRFNKGDTAYEVGYYKVTMYKDGEVDKFFLGRFHVVLKKIEGKWKIAQDWDASKINGVSVTEEDFEKAKGG
ncbi:MAG: nuclear transport factor 2 family protein [Bacteroidota bacterium]